MAVGCDGRPVARGAGVSGGAHGRVAARASRPFRATRPDPASSAVQVTAGHFGPAEAPVFGHLHRPVIAAWSGRAVVLCPPFGYEAMSTHRTLRELADALACAGHVCLRLDPPGTGDSADPPGHDGGASLATWPDAIVAAMDHLRGLLGEPAFVLVGARVGALAAARAAQGRADVIGWAGLAPLTRGRLMARECKALGLATQARTGLGEARADGAIEAGGFRLSVADVATLGGWTLADLPPPAPHGLLLARPGQEDELRALPWMAQAAAASSAWTLATLDGYDDMMQVPHFAQVPRAALATLCAWVDRLPVAPRATLPAEALRPASLLPGGAVREQAVEIPAAGTVLRGVLAMPVHGVPAHAVVMINTGAEHRVGSNRMYVGWSRHWAQRGCAALRVDLSGLGESPPHLAGQGNHVHNVHALDDLRAICVWLRQQHGIPSLHLVGLCSGAFHAFTAAVEGVPFQSVTPINQMVYFWQDRMPLLGEAEDAVAVAVVAGAGRSLRDPARWRKLLRGEVRVGLILRALARRAGQRASVPARALLRVAGWPLHRDLPTALGHAAGHGTRVHWVFSEGEPGLTMLREQGGRTLHRALARGRAQLTVLPQTDHTFTLQAMQQRLFDAVDTGLDACVPSTREAA